MEKEGQITVRNAENIVGQYPYALIYRSSGIWLGETSRADLNGLFDEAAYMGDGYLEARFFSGTGELHLFRMESSARASVTTFAGQKYYDVKFVIKPQFHSSIAGNDKKKYTRIVVRRIIDQDNDGQTVVIKTCLAGLEE